MISLRIYINIFKKQILKMARRTTISVQGRTATKMEYTNRTVGRGNGRDIFLFATASRPALGPTQLPSELSGALSLWVKRPSSSNEVKNT